MIGPRKFSWSLAQVHAVVLTPSDTHRQEGQGGVSVRAEGVERGGSDP